MPSGDYGRIRSFIDRALEQRSRPGIDPIYLPSDYWLFFAEHFSYVRSLPDDELQQIRRHTWHLTGDQYLRYLFYKPKFAASVAGEYRRLAESLEFFADEGPRGIGFDVDGRTVSEDLIRYLQVLRDLCDAGLRRTAAPIRVLEIGGGYGGLASLIVSFHPCCSYVLVDLEETMFFQAVHLTNQFGTERVHLCPNGLDDTPELQPGCFYLVPQQKSGSVSSARFDWAVNQQSMQEMNHAQVVRYCDLLAKCATSFYSCNLDRHPDRVSGSMGLVVDLRDIFNERFVRERWRPRASQSFAWQPSQLLQRRRRSRHSDARLPRAVYQCQ